MINLKEKIQLNQIKAKHKHIGDFLEIKFIEVTENSLIATMPVTSKTHQPWGILHGGASVVLAETIGSYGSSLLIDTEQYMAVGLEVNANHLRPVKSGYVKGIGTPIHIGRKTHVWDIKIYNEQEKIVCISRLTVAIVDY
jgi:1,4-dihydroxy-2-naphthoyl-CoA hydrolase